VWITVSFVVNAHVRTHSAAHELPLRVPAGKVNILLRRQLNGQGNLNLADKLGVIVALGFLRGVTERCAVIVLGGACSGRRISVWTTSPLRE
jgi:hypothetical protein